jgi:hypothetical protein
MGMIARLSIRDRRLFQSLEADKISDAVSRPIRHITVITLKSDNPGEANILTAEVAAVVLTVLKALVTLAALIVLSVLVVMSELLTMLELDIAESNSN